MKKNFTTPLLTALLTVYSLVAFASGGTNEGSEGAKEKFNPGEMILHHISDSHEWHFATFGSTHVTLPLPVILYSPEKGLKVFSSAKFHGGEGTQHQEVAHGSAIEHQIGHESDAYEQLPSENDTANFEAVKADEAHGGHHALSAAYEGYALDEHDKIVALDHHKFYDLSITKNVASMLISAILLIVIFVSVAGAYKKRLGQAPTGMQNFFEVFIAFIRDEVAKPALHGKADRYLPYLLTLFFFIWFNNLLGLLPGGANLTGNIAVTLTLAFLTFLITTFSGNKAYWGHVFNTPGVPWWLKTVLPIMPIVETIGLFTKPFSLMVRLFANITAGHIIILSLTCLTFIFESYAVGIGTAAFALAMNFLELLVAVVQAYIFTLLTANYIGAAVEEHHGDHH